MNRGSVLNLPFLGQIVKVTTRDGREYEMKISEEVPDNPYLFSVMYRVSDGSSSGGYDPHTLKPNRPPPPVVRTAKPGKDLGNSNSKSTMENVLLRNGKTILIDNKSVPESKGKISAPIFNTAFIKPPEDEKDKEKKSRRRGVSDIGKIIVK